MLQGILQITCNLNNREDGQTIYVVDNDKKDMRLINATTFQEQNIKERQHLQEQIAKNPNSLGEELLIIQKEFAGFSDTNERLDLLALDK